MQDGLLEARTIKGIWSRLEKRWSMQPGLNPICHDALSSLYVVQLALLEFGNGIECLCSGVSFIVIPRSAAGIERKQASQNELEVFSLCISFLLLLKTNVVA